MDTLDVHALGTSGAGKTVFMAAMYERTRLRRADSAFYLRTPHSASLDLNAVFNRVADPDGDWPEASQDIREWEFTVTVPAAQEDVPALALRYLDYPGGILTNPHTGGDERVDTLVDRLTSANGLLVLLDGQALLANLRGEPRARRYLDVDLAAVLEVAQRSRCPIHFVVTKWDLVAPEFELTAVRDLLVADENFSDLLAAKKATIPAPMRLLPVSAVGTGFAQAMPDGRMAKSGEPARPQGVELPLAAVLPDFMQFAHAEIARRADDLDNTEVRPSKVMAAVNRPDAAAKVGAVLAMLVQRVAPVVAQRVLGNNPGLAHLLTSKPDTVANALTGLADRVLAAGVERERLSRARRIEQLHLRRRAVASTREAFELVERQCVAALADLEVAHPESVLAGGIAAFLREHPVPDSPVPQP